MNGTKGIISEEKNHIKDFALLLLFLISTIIRNNRKIK